MKLLWKHMQSNRHRFILALSVGLIYTAVCVIVPIISGRLINGFIESVSNGIRTLSLYLACSLLQILFFLWDQKASKHFEICQKQMMRKAAFEAISDKNQLSKEDIASYSSFINNDIPTASSQYFLGTIDIVKCIAMICFSAFSLMRVHYALGFIVIVLSAGIVYVPNLIRDKSGAARTAYSEAMAAYNTQLQSFLGGIRIISSFLYQKRANTWMEKQNAAVAVSETVLCRHQRFVQGITAFLQTSKTVLILSVGVMLITKKEISVGDLIVVLELDAVIGAPIEFLSYMIHGKNEAAPLVSQYDKMFEAKAPAAHLTAIGQIDDIELKDVHYCAGELEILQGISLKLEKNKKYMITGSSGSGKSTLLNILAQMTAPTSGSMLVNGLDAAAIDQSSYRSKVCIVFQEPYLFETTLEENILLGRSIPHSRYREVVERLQLSYLLERYADSAMSPALANTLSGGEKQRICLARAMVGQPEFYLLDEVTSALDKDTAWAIESAILSEKAAVIHVCHKPTAELYSQYDQHLRIEHGMITE